MQTTRSTAWAAAALAIVAASTACGTTVPGAAGGVAAGGAAAGSGLAAGTGGAPAGGALGPAASSGPGAAFSSSGAAAAPGGAAAGTGTSVTGQVAAPGSTGGGTTGSVAARDKTPVKIGAFYLDGGNTALGAGFAATPVNFGDGQLEAKAVVADINAHGGIGGRPIQLFLQKFEATDASKPAAYEAACNALAEDHHVVAILSMFNLRTPLAACAKKHRTILISTALGSGDDAIYREFGDWAFTPSEMSLDTEQKLVLSNAFAPT